MCADGSTCADPGCRIETLIGATIMGAIGQHEPGVVTKWVAIVESVNTDGERGLWTMASAGIKAYETLGMLTYAQNLEQARMRARNTDG